jgi:hypothetical protein
MGGPTATAPRYKYVANGQNLLLLLLLLFRDAPRPRILSIDCLSNQIYDMAMAKAAALPLIALPGARSYRHQAGR